MFATLPSRDAVDEPAVSRRSGDRVAISGVVALLAATWTALAWAASQLALASLRSAGCPTDHTRGYDCALALVAIVAVFPWSLAAVAARSWYARLGLAAAALVSAAPAVWAIVQHFTAGSWRGRWCG